MDDQMYVNAVKSDIRKALVNQKGNSCPLAVRLAWHASGTYSKHDDTGGSYGATMRFPPEKEDGANAGLDIERDILQEVKRQHPDLSYADIWTLAGAHAIEIAGGPPIEHKLGRTDAQDGSACPAVGRLPDASQGAEHLREVFYRMGFNDEDIVALSGAHTLGRCHKTRSGFDGPWTHEPLKFDNSYFKNLLDLEWKPRQWDGPLQYEDPSHTLMMLPTDLALKTDPKFKEYVVAFAKSETVFRSAFKRAYEQLLCLGCPAHVVPSAAPVAMQSREEADGSLEFAQARGGTGLPPTESLGGRVRGRECHGKPWGRVRGRECHCEFGVVGVAGGPRLLRPPAAALPHSHSPLAKASHRSLSCASPVRPSVHVYL